MVVPGISVMQLNVACPLLTNSSIRAVLHSIAICRNKKENCEEVIGEHYQRKEKACTMERMDCQVYLSRGIFFKPNFY